MKRWMTREKKSRSREVEKSRCEMTRAMSMDNKDNRKEVGGCQGRRCRGAVGVALARSTREIKGPRQRQSRAKYAVAKGRRGREVGGKNYIIREAN